MFDVVKVRDDNFEVNVGFENVCRVRSSFRDFSAELKAMSVTGTGFNSIETLSDVSAAKKVDNFTTWSYIFLVKTTPQLEGFYRMPSAFSINYD